MPAFGVPILRTGLLPGRARRGPPPRPPGLRAAALGVGLALAPLQALADHGMPATPTRGIDWTTWVLVAGAVVALGLAAWAFLAPERAEPPAPESPTRGEAPPRPGT